MADDLGNSTAAFAHTRSLVQRARSADRSVSGPATEELLTTYRPLVRHCAHRFAGRGEDLEDLLQVATLGLLKSIAGFDPDRGVAFRTYATPMVLGELRRHFRDRVWAVHVPRRVQELRRELARAESELARTGSADPTTAQVADHLGLDTAAVEEARAARSTRTALPLEAVEDQHSLGIEDPGIELAELRASLGPLLAELPARERHILGLRFVLGRTQAEIAAEVGVSQMHVSRLLARSLATLRRGWTREPVQPSRASDSSIAAID